jgi:uncharacterized membrane protein (UPF0136 family)
MPVLLLPIIKTVNRDAMLLAKFFPVRGALMGFFHKGKHLSLSLSGVTHALEIYQSAKINHNLRLNNMHHTEGLLINRYTKGYDSTYQYKN